MKRGNDTKARFAQYLADGLTPAIASGLIGFSQAYGRALLQRIKRDLGPQAR